MILCLASVWTFQLRSLHDTVIHCIKILKRKSLYSKGYFLQSVALDIILYRIISYHLFYHIILLHSIRSPHISQKFNNAQRVGCKNDRWTCLFFRPEVPEEELDERSVSRILSSFTFLSLHHTFNQVGMHLAV